MEINRNLRMPGRGNQAAANESDIGAGFQNRRIEIWRYRHIENRGSLFDYLIDIGASYEIARKACCQNNDIGLFKIGKVTGDDLNILGRSLNLAFVSNISDEIVLLLPREVQKDGAAD